MDRVDLTIKQVGDQWCLFTKDGTRKLGCHDTREGAQAQEAAIYAQERLAKTTGAIQLGLTEIDVEDGEHEVLENGDVVKWIPLAMAGEKWTNGGREFDITPELVGQAIKNFEARDKAPLPVTLGHVDDSGAPAAAWIEDIEQRQPDPWGKLHFLKKTWARVVEGEYKYFSLEFIKESRDGKGNEIGFQIVGGGIVNDPFFPIRIDQAAARGASCFRLSRFTNQKSGQGREENAIMTEAEKAAADKAAADAAAAAEKTRLEQVKIDGDRVSLTRTQYDALMRSQREVEGLRGQLATASDEKSTLESRVVKLERSRTADKIRLAVERLQDDGVVVQLGDFVLKNDQDCFDWLARAPWGVTTAEGLDKLSTDREQNAHLPRIRLGGEKAGGTDRVPPVDLSTEAGRNEAVRRCKAELQRTYSPEELKTQLRRRGGDIDAFSRELVAADHPEHRKQILAKN